MKPVLFILVLTFLASPARAVQQSFEYLIAQARDNLSVSTAAEFSNSTLIGRWGLATADCDIASDVFEVSSSQISIGSDVASIVEYFIEQHDEAHPQVWVLHIVGEVRGLIEIHARPVEIGLRVFGSDFFGLTVYKRCVQE